ncbi:hypothetical protein HWV62_34847 [Athelia sp. TMB]|nr:hypothetical protein HWV62_34847 [Athelia sp. TMB]
MTYDVQHALKVKARREARLQGLPSTSPQRDPVQRTSTPPRAAVAHTVQPPKLPGASKRSDSLTSEIDFSPSTALAPLHPVPLSSNGGATLDWTGPLSDDEKSDKKWALHMTRGKSKEKVPMASKDIVEKQDAIFTDRIARVRSEAKAQTLRKAAITAEQLQRRYNLVYRSLTGPDRVNPAAAARWYAAAGSETQSSIDEVEPLTWIKHLLDRRGRRQTNRLPWHLSALIVEEYVRSRMRPEMMESIPEHQASPPSTSLQGPSSPYSVRSRPSSIIPSIPGTAYDGHVSFEPYVESSRAMSEDSRRSDDGYLRTWRNSLVATGDSPYSSISGSPATQAHPPRSDYDHSPLSSRINIKGITNRARRKAQGSDDGSSSARNSISGDQDSTKKPRKGLRPMELALHLDGRKDERRVRSLPTSEIEDVQEEFEPPMTVRARHRALSEDDGQPTAMPQPEPDMKAAEQLPDPAPRAAPVRRGPRVPAQSLLTEEQQHANEYHQREFDEEEEKREYELKAQLLDEIMARNHRIRQSLQRVAAGVRDYDVLQGNLMKSFQVPYRALPADLLDAFCHDPSAVTGVTRSYKGWRAVEDIHNRVIRQRETFRAFLSSSPNPPIASKSVFDEPISVLHDLFGKLEARQAAIAAKAREITGILTRVKGIHASVKTDYNETVAHTSVAYPELSQIIALEESYKDQYQQLWEFGLDTLTVILDTVTPFWRTYGKTIGEDVQDFLIIPLYRNEFTGEPKRYPILHLPKRSFRHWLGLLIFFITAVAVTAIQFYAIMGELSYHRLPWSALNGLRWAVIPIFWMAIVGQIIATLVELSIVATQLAVFIWWLGWLFRIFA